MTEYPIVVRLCCLLLAAFASPRVLLAQSEALPQNLEHLGDQRYRIGEIVVDRERRSFTVPGKVLHLDDTLEYLAVARNGQKAYESLLELSTTGMDFNLACILIGLDDKFSVKPSYQFDENKPDGQRVSITIDWQKDGERRSTSGAEALKIGDETFTDESWVYIGSFSASGGREFMAHSRGTLIGFVHDPYNVIEHVNGAGIGNYGLVTGNEGNLPAEGAAVELTVKVTETDAGQ